MADPAQTGPAMQTGYDMPFPANPFAMQPFEQRALQQRRDQQAASQQSFRAIGGAGLADVFLQPFQTSLNQLRQQGPQGTVIAGQTAALSGAVLDRLGYGVSSYGGAMLNVAGQMATPGLGHGIRGADNMHVQQQMAESLMRQTYKLGGVGGLSSQEIGSTIIPQLVQEGAFAGVEATIGKDGSLDAKSVTRVEEIIQKRIKMVTELAKGMEGVPLNQIIGELRAATGLATDANPEEVARMAGRLREAANNNSLNPATMLQATAMTRAAATEALLSRGASPTAALRVSGALAMTSMEDAAMMNTTQLSRVAQVRAAGGHAISFSPAEIAAANAQVTAKALQEHGASEMATMGYVMENRDLTDAQREWMSKRMESLKNAPDKAKWAIETREELSRMGINVAELRQAKGGVSNMIGSLSDEMKQRVVSAQKAGSAAGNQHIKATVNSLAATGALADSGLSKEQAEKNLTVFNEFSGDTQKKLLEFGAAGDMDGLRAFMAENGLLEIAGEHGVGLQGIAEMVTGKRAGVLRHGMSNISRDAYQTVGAEDRRRNRLKTQATESLLEEPPIQKKTFIESIIEGAGVDGSTGAITDEVQKRAVDGNATFEENLRATNDGAAKLDKLLQNADGAANLHGTPVNIARAVSQSTAKVQQQDVAVMYVRDVQVVKSQQLANA